MSRTLLALILIMVALVASCTSGQPSSPSPTPGPPLTTAELKLRLIDELGPLWYCDPDFYPIAVFDEADQAKKRFGEVQADTEAFAAIVARLGIDPGTVTDDGKLAIYRLWKQLNAIVLEPADGGTYRIDWQVPADFDLANQVCARAGATAQVQHARKAMPRGHSVHAFRWNSFLSAARHFCVVMSSTIVTNCRGRPASSLNSETVSQTQIVRPSRWR
jgi:hypothetical protein